MRWTNQQSSLELRYQVLGGDPIGMVSSAALRERCVLNLGYGSFSELRGGKSELGKARPKLRTDNDLKSSGWYYDPKNH